MSLWTTIRDTAESAAVLVGNYYIPGSSLLTSSLVSKGSQGQLGSDIGKIAQLGSSIYGFTNGPLMNPSTSGTTPATTPTTGTTEPLTPAAATANPTAAAAQATNISTATPSVGGSPIADGTGTFAGVGGGGVDPSTVSTWGKISGYLEKNPVVGMMGANIAISGLSGIEAAKVAKEKQDYERQQYDRQIANLNAPTAIPLRSKPYRPISGIVNGRLA